MNLSTVSAFKNIETKDGMVEISGERLKQLQFVLTDMLKDINEICEKYGLVYTLGGGSCLGAVRHQGFIPWDDDIDVNMPRRDFRKFVKIIQEKYSEKYVIHIPGKTENSVLCFGQLRRKNTIVRALEDYHMPDEECGACIDIFIIEDIPDFMLFRFVHGLGSMVLGFALSCRKYSANLKEYLWLAGTDEEKVSAFRTKAAIGKLFSFVSLSGWIRAWDAWNGLFSGRRRKYISIPVGRKHYFGEIQLEGDYFPVSQGIFNGIKVPLPANTDSYLTALYGSDYMELPPVEKREHHVVYDFDLSMVLPSELETEHTKG